MGNRLSHSNLNDQRVGDGRLMESNWTKPRDDSKKRKNSPSPSKGREGKATTIKIERGTTIVKPRTITVEHGAS